jgi:dihydroorotate dehydrogenase electron transfer subunit
MKYIKDFRVVSNRSLNEEHFLLELEANEKLPELSAGQFAEVRVDGSPNTLLRRPLSIHDVDYEQNKLWLFIKKVGEGTHQLGRLQEGDNLNMILPLGQGFTIPDSGEVLLVGGGCGVAPMLYLARKLAEKGIRPKILLGGKTKTDISEVPAYEKLGIVEITTEDGSEGTRGLVTEHRWLQEQESAYQMVYACGPEPMMKAVNRWAQTKNTELEVSLENTMACGIGACLTCVVDTTSGNKLACTDGPVFNTKELKW